MTDSSLRYRRSQTRCGVYALMVETETQGEWLLIPARCKSWGCRECGPWLARRWIDTLLHHDLQATHFATFTLDPSILEDAGILTDYAAQHRWLSQRLRSIIQALRRRFGAFRYFRVFEFHSGRFDKRRGIHNHRLHVHLLLECPAIPSPGFSPDACRANPALQPYDPSLDIIAQVARRNRLGRTVTYALEPRAPVTPYVAKYCGKARSKAGGGTYRMRIVSTSRGLTHPRPGTPARAWFVSAHDLVRPVTAEMHLRQQLLSVTAGAHCGLSMDRPQFAWPPTTEQRIRQEESGRVRPQEIDARHLTSALPHVHDRGLALLRIASRKVLRGSPEALPTHPLYQRPATTHYPCEPSSPPMSSSPRREATSPSP